MWGGGGSDLFLVLREVLLHGLGSRVGPRRGWGWRGGHGFLLLLSPTQIHPQENAERRHHPWVLQLPGGARGRGGGVGGGRPPDLLQSPPPEPKIHPSAPLKPTLTPQYPKSCSKKLPRTPGLITKLVPTFPESLRATPATPEFTPITPNAAPNTPSPHPEPQIQPQIFPTPTHSPKYPQNTP